MGSAFRYITKTLRCVPLPVWVAAAGISLFTSQYVVPRTYEVSGVLQEIMEYESIESKGKRIRVSGCPHQINVWQDDWNETAMVGDHVVLEVARQSSSYPRCIEMDDGKENGK